MNKRKRSVERAATNGRYEQNDFTVPLLDIDSHKSDHEPTDLRGDRANIAILFFLYLLQGIPLGLTAAIPMLLQNRGASYKQQAEFSFATWPFSMKLLWAPIVDSLFWSRFGRRKSWLIPTQYLIGVFMLILSVYVNQWLGSDGIEPNLPVLTAVFFAMNFFAATQDIAVDGWALTMLKRCNVGHASTCNSVGQTAGYFFGYVVFIALESRDFCNSYLRSVPEDDGLVTLPSFLWFWGICFMITTTLIAIMKRERDQRNRDKTDETGGEEELELGIRETYQLLLKIINMRPIKILASILLTVKFTFAACDSVTSLKLIEAGLPKEKLALLAVPMVPLQIFLPLVISKYTNGPKPMEIYLKALPLRIVFGIFAAVIVTIAPYTLSASGEVPVYLYGLLLLNYAVYQIFLYCMFVAVMAFFAKISDPTVGGTYMTLLNTICNLGGNWPTSLVLWLVDVLTWKKCVINTTASGMPNEFDSTCQSKHEQDACVSAGGECETSIDGYYIECIICLLYGLIWLRWGTSRIRELQAMPMSEWRIAKNDKSTR